MFRGVKECIFLEKVNTALQNLENHKVLLREISKELPPPLEIENIHTEADPLILMIKSNSQCAL